MRGGPLSLSSFYSLESCTYPSNTQTHIRPVPQQFRGLDMRLIAVHLPEKIVEDIQRLVDKGLYPNRSEAIRNAIRDLLKRELWDGTLNTSGHLSEVVG